MRRLLLFAAALGLAAPASGPDWRVIGPGGGGTLFYPTVSPHDPRTVLVACDMTGGYVTHDGGTTWKMFNLGAPPRFFVFDPLDARVMYAEANGLFRSADGGATWTRFLPRAADITEASMGDDHGEARLTASGAAPLSHTAFAVDPADSRSMLLATGGQRAELWHSMDGGDAWRKVADLAGRASRVWIDPHSPRGDRTLYLAGPNAIFIRQERRWRTGESLGGFAYVDAAWPETGPPTFYATSGKTIFVSAGGERWRESPLPGLEGQAGAIAVSLNHPEIAYVSYQRLRTPAGQRMGVAKTTDGGRHWELVREDGRDPAANVRDAWLGPRFGAGWPGNPRDLAVAPGDPNIVYTADSGRIMRTADGGKTWGQAYSMLMPDGNWTTNGLDVTTCYGVHFDPFDPRRMFISYTDIGLFASDNGGGSWYSATRNGVPGAWVNTTYWVEFDPTTRGRMWAAMSNTHDLPRPKMWRNRGPETYQGGIARSDDGGRTWRAQTDGMPPIAPTHILRTPEGTLYVAAFGRGVYESTDLGEHWSLRNTGIEGDQPFAWRLARDAKGALYLVAARRSDDGSFGNSGDGAVYRSTDGAAHWTRLALPRGVNGPNGLAIDPKDPARLYLAAWGRSTREGAMDGGIYLSTDAGATWRRVLTEDQHVYDVTVDPADPQVLYACGFEQAAWRSTDRGLTWKRIPGFGFKWGHRVVVDPRDRARLYVTTFGGSVWTAAVR
jgi:photosystem II stability/assembly factor-like uncharacterized protein